MPVPERLARTLMTGNAAKQNKKLAKATMYTFLTPNVSTIFENAKMLKSPFKTPQTPEIMPMVKLLKPSPPREMEEEYMRGMSTSKHWSMKARNP